MNQLIYVGNIFASLWCTTSVPDDDTVDRYVGIYYVTRCMIGHVGSRNHRLLYLLRLIVHCWLVPEPLRRSVGRRVHIVPLGKLQCVVRRAAGCAAKHYSI